MIGDPGYAEAFVHGHTTLAEYGTRWNPSRPGARVLDMVVRRDHGISVEEWPGECLSSLDDDLAPAPRVDLENQRLLGESFLALRGLLSCAATGCGHPALVMIYDPIGQAWPICQPHWPATRRNPRVSPACTWIFENMRRFHRGEEVEIGGTPISEVMPPPVAPSLRTALEIAYTAASDIRISPAHVRS